MTSIQPPSPDRPYRPCEIERLPFCNTAELDDLAEGLGQDRTVGVAHFGIGMRHAGYNLYLMGRPGSGKRHLIRQLLDGRVGGEAPPADGCYVHNLEQPHKPRAIETPAGISAFSRRHPLTRDAHRFFLRPLQRRSGHESRILRQAAERREGARRAGDHAPAGDAAESHSRSPPVTGRTPRTRVAAQGRGRAVRRWPVDRRPASQLRRFCQVGEYLGEAQRNVFVSMDEFRRAKEAPLAWCSPSAAVS